MYLETAYIENNMKVGAVCTELSTSLVYYSVKQEYLCLHTKEDRREKRVWGECASVCACLRERERVEEERETRTIDGEYDAGLSKDALVHFSRLHSRWLCRHLVCRGSIARSAGHLACPGHLTGHLRAVRWTIVLEND